MRVSIAFKIFVIVLAVLLLMGAVAAITTSQARKVSGQLDRVVGTYIPAYAALARVEIRSLEQALALRRLIIAQQAGAAEDAVRARLRSAFEGKGAEVARELAAARALIAMELASRSPFADVAGLAQLDARLEMLQDERAPYDAQVATTLRRLASGDRAAMLAELERLEAIRDQLNRRLEQARTAMRELMLAAASEARAEQERVVQVSIVVTALAAALGLGLAAIMSLALVRPVKRLLAGTQAIESGVLNIEIPVTSSDEIGGLTSAFNRMVAELRAKARIRDTFGKYVDPRIVAGLIDRPELAPEGERRTMTAFFCDLKGFSALGEQLTPKNLVTVTNRYLTVMSEPVRAHQGILDKYIGDAIMAYWGPPFTEGDQQAVRACLAALEMVDRLPSLLAELPELTGLRRGLPQLGLRVGIATGPVLVGNIGSEAMRSYTVLGRSVNLAARLEQANKHYGTAILISEEAATMVRDAVELREIDIVVAVGQQEPERVFEVAGRKGTLDEARQRLHARYAEALSAYRRRDWAAARTALAAALEIVPGDGPTQALLAHIDWWITNPPAADWTGAWHLAEK